MSEINEANEAKTPRFEAQYTQTQALVREYYTQSQPLWFLIAMGFIIFGLLGLGIYNIVLMLQYPGESIFHGVVLVALAILYLVYTLLRPAMYARKRFKIDQEVYGSFTATYRFYDDEIAESVTDGSHLTLSYDKIRKVTQTRHLILLWRAQRICHVLEKERLTGGTPEEFLFFLKEKAPQAKGLK